MSFLRKKLPIILGGFFVLFALWSIMTVQTPPVYAACSADLQSEIRLASLPDYVLVGKEFTFDIDVTNT